MKTETETETDTIDSHFTLCEAAPDLLDALEKIVISADMQSFLPVYFDFRISPELIKNAKAAIRKAKGDK